MKKQHVVKLTESEREQLQQLIAAGTAAARQLMHARVLRGADAGPQGPGWKDRAIAMAVEVGEATVERVRKRYVSEGLEAALRRKPPAREYVRKLGGEQEAHLIALACSPPPAGRAAWSLRLLAAKLVQLGEVEHLSHETVRSTFKQTRSNRG